ncbi:NAD-dependent epimerase/dehydratase family protein [Polynucleobacter paneuropaeus]|jgi:nucleoside-diphosphate-sugar epimerase|uniref:NAD-dependent epimerase/dehydratase family protein n=1 Tax=Polynucleobacter paneuropaeus TaxID=2527775 RepID=UPI001BFD527A|nr:NAD-dependent epimerase/dehydratase family protein [Polynucleobacter paneuropaeus]MBT8632136.1 NAD-dependent epimerase/dehydratase family protein [Polynucleobacter paneuropaeus]
MSVNQQVALITGATGFVGAHLAKRLIDDGWEVHALIRDGSKIPNLLINEKLSLHSYDGRTETLVQCMSLVKPNVVFHLASLFLSQHETKDIEPLIQSNLLFGSQLLEAMRANNISNLINTGTSWQHYSNESYNPVCLYAATKQAFEAIIEYYIQACNFKVITLKLFDTYGPNDHRPKLIAMLNNAEKNNQPLDMSTGEQLIDLVHIDDVVDAYLMAAHRLLEKQIFCHERFAISSGNPIPLKQLVQLYIKATGKNIQVNWGARPYRFREVMNTWSEGVPINDWQIFVSLEDGFKALDQ